MKTKIIEPHKSSLGNLDANMLSALLLAAYIVLHWLTVLVGYIPIVGWLIGGFLGFLKWISPILVIVVIFIEKNSRFVKYSALHSLIFTIVFTISSFVYGIFSGILGAIIGNGTVNTVFWIIGGVGGLIMTALFGLFAFMAFQYKQAELPGISGLVDKIVEKLEPANKQK